MVDLEATLRSSLDRCALGRALGAAAMSLVILATALKHNRDVATIALVEGPWLGREEP